MSRLIGTVLIFAIGGALVIDAKAQTAGLGLRPMRIELEARPGDEQTGSFMIEAPPSDTAVSGRLILSLSDWQVAEDTTVSYHDPGSQPNSASAWLTFSPTDLTISSGHRRLVRVTARVPQSAAPGVYTSAVFVQERPPTNVPKQGEQRLYFRYRYVVTVYVVIAPVTRQGELTDLRLSRPAGHAEGRRLECELNNAGTRHLRPSLTWSVRSGDEELLSVKDVEATVLLPSLKTRETLPIPQPLPPGEYEIEVQADFHDARPVQSLKRVVVVGQ